MEFVLISFMKPDFKWFNFRMLKEFVPISFMKPDVRKTLNIISLARNNIKIKF